MFHFILMLLPLLPSLAHRTPHISYITQEQIKDIGGTVELECSVQYAEQYSVFWTKTLNEESDSIFISAGRYLVIKDSRYTLLNDPSSSTYTLQIKDIQETDEGIYQCQVVLSTVNKISADVVVSVRRPLVITDNSTQSLVVSEGESAQMECYASGVPHPTISWTRANNAILPTGGITYSGSVLKINAVRKEDRGVYICLAVNGVSKGTWRRINLDVEYAPIVTVPRPRVGQALHYNIDLECHIEANPIPAIIWLKDEIQLYNNDHFSISHFATTDVITDSTIRMLTLADRQYGDYVCKAGNKLGMAEATIHLFENVIPVCLPDCSPYCGDLTAFNYTTTRCNNNTLNEPDCSPYCGNLSSALNSTTSFNNATLNE